MGNQSTGANKTDNRCAGMAIIVYEHTETLQNRPPTPRNEFPTMYSQIATLFLMVVTSRLPAAAMYLLPAALRLEIVAN